MYSKCLVSPAFIIMTSQYFAIAPNMITGRSSDKHALYVWYIKWQLSSVPENWEMVERERLV